MMDSSPQRMRNKRIPKSRRNPKTPKIQRGGGTSEDLGEEITPPETGEQQTPPDETQEPETPEIPEEKPGENDGQENPDKDNANEGGEQNPDGDKPAEDEKPVEGEGGDKLPEGEKKPEGAELPKQDEALPEKIEGKIEAEEVPFDEVKVVPDISGSEPEFLESFGSTGLYRAPRANSSSVLGFYGQQLQPWAQELYKDLYAKVSNPTVDSDGWLVGASYAVNKSETVEFDFDATGYTEEQISEKARTEFSNRVSVISKNMTDELDLDRQMQSIYDAINLDHSEIFFWVEVTKCLRTGGPSARYNVSTRTTGSNVHVYVTGSVDLPKIDINLHNDSINAFDTAYGTTVEEMIKAMSDLDNAISSFSVTGGNRYAKVKSIHDRIIDQVTYDLNGEMAHDPNGALIAPYHAVCEGYAKAFKAICDAKGIPCQLGWGDSYNSQGDLEGHMWNYVQMDDGNWYPLDATWDDQSTTSYIYFLTGTKETGFDEKTFEQDHIARSNYTDHSINFVYPGPISETKYDPNAVVNPTYSLSIEGKEKITVKTGYIETPEFYFEISNTGTGALNVTLALDKDDVFTLSKDTLALDGGATETVTVTAAAGKEVGTYQAVLTVSDEDHQVSETKTFTLEVADKSLVAFSGVPENSTSVYNGQVQSVGIDGITAQAEDGTKFTAKDFTVSYTQDGSAASREVRNAGTYTVTVRLDTAGYTGETTFTHTITPVALTLTAKAENREYDGTTAVKVTASFSGVLGSDDVKADPASVPTTGTMEDKHGGKDKKVSIDLSKAVLTGKDAANYTLEGVSSETTVTISPKPIEFHIYAEPKVYDGNTNAKFRAEFTGLIEGDRIPTVEAEPTFNQANVGKNISITVRNVQTRWDVHFRDNYDYGGRIYRHGADITPKPVTVTFGANEFTYDGSPKAMTAAYTDVKGQQQQASLAYTDADGKTATPIKAGKYTATASIADTNYELTGEKTASMTITAGKLTFSAPTITIRRGSTDPVTAQLAVSAPQGSAAPKGKFEIESISDSTLINASITENGLLSVSLKPGTTASSEIKVRFVPEEGTYEPVSATVTVNVKDFKAVDTLKGNPANVKFGEDLPAMQVVCEYDFGGGDKETKTLDVTKDMLQGFDNAKLGDQEVTLTINDNGYTRTLKFQVKVVDFAKSIVVKTEPSKKDYTLNQDKALDLTGGIATVTMASGAEKEVSLSATEITCTGFDSGIFGEQSISIVYKDKYSEVKAENAFAVIVSSSVSADAPNQDPALPSLNSGRNDLVIKDENGDETPIPEDSRVELFVDPVKEEDKDTVEDVVKDLPETTGKMSVEISLKITGGDNDGQEVQPKEGSSITIRLPFPGGTDKSFTFSLYHIRNGKVEKVNVITNNNGITFTVTSLSPFVLTWKEPAPTPPTPSRPGSGSSVSYDDDDEDTLTPAQLRQQEENDFWDDVQSAIYSARRGDTLRIEAGSYNVPARILNTLAERSGLTLVLVDEDGREVKIPSDQVKAPRGNTIKLAYSMGELAKLYADTNTNNGVSKLNVAGTAGTSAGTTAPNTQNGSISSNSSNPNTGVGDVIQMIAPQSAFKDPEKGVKVVQAQAPTAPTGAVYEKESTDSKEVTAPVQMEESPVQEKSGSRLPAVLAVAAALLCAAGLVWKFGFLDGKFRNLRK